MYDKQIPKKNIMHQTSNNERLWAIKLKMFVKPSCTYDDVDDDDKGEMQDYFMKEEFVVSYRLYLNIFFTKKGLHGIMSTL